MLNRRSFSLIAVYMRTGALTRPKEMLPAQIARGGAICSRSSLVGPRGRGYVQSAARGRLPAGNALATPGVTATVQYLAPLRKRHAAGWLGGGRRLPGAARRSRGGGGPEFARGSATPGSRGPCSTWHRDGRRCAVGAIRRG